MIAKRIVDMIMSCEHIPFETIEERDSKEGFSEAFSDYHNKWERHDFEIDGKDITINGEYIINDSIKGTRKKVAILCHGQTVTRAGIIKYAKVFYDLGYNLVIFDERSFGKTGGKYCTLGYKEHEDIYAVVKYTRKIFGEDCFLGMLGESMGAGSALLSLKYHTPDYVIADCPFADTGLLIADLARNNAGFLGTLSLKRAEKLCDRRYPGYSFNKVKPIEAVSETETPICFMHGAEDKLIDCKHSRMMFEKCKNSRSEIHYYDKTDHARSIYNHTEEYIDIMTAFIKKIEAELFI